MTTSTITKENYISIPKNEYIILKNIYELNKKQQDLTRIYEVEKNIETKNYKKVNIDDFINSI
ncbi:MAG: hypothetical protein PHS49_07035 [Candidatus Gracilibacteria bacterium]|nr:hypothetical protein [Candidatus Gracilibacteria bacterium]